MGVQDSLKLYLPFEFLIINKQLIIKEDCSKEQLFPGYSVVKSINNVSATELIKKMSLYIPADGVNQTFKYYNLYNYYYFHYLFNLFYPDKKGVSIVLETKSKRNYADYYIELLKPKVIENNYFNKNRKGISQFDKQLSYKSDLPNKTGYLKIGSFYSGFIESLGQKYEPFLDSAFTDIKMKNLQNLILDLRDNEGGGDYYKLLLSYLSVNSTKQTKLFAPGREFNYTKYAVNMPEDLIKYIANPDEFLVSKNSLELKGDNEPKTFPFPKNSFNGSIIVLTNGGTFSASTYVVSDLYTERKNTNRKIFFVGEENGGDIYCNSLCAGLSYIIKLPNSSIAVDVPLLCFDEFKNDYPKKRLPDYEVFDKITDLKAKKDAVLDFAIKKFNKK
jgi:Peptidase family S41